MYVRERKRHASATTIGLREPRAVQLCSPKAFLRIGPFVPAFLTLTDASGVDTVFAVIMARLSSAALFRRGAKVGGAVAATETLRRGWTGPGIEALVVDEGARETDELSEAADAGRDEIGLVGLPPKLEDSEGRAPVPTILARRLAALVIRGATDGSRSALRSAETRLRRPPAAVAVGLVTWTGPDVLALKLARPAGLANRVCSAFTSRPSRKRAARLIRTSTLGFGVAAGGLSPTVAAADWRRARSIAARSAVEMLWRTRGVVVAVDAGGSALPSRNAAALLIRGVIAGAARLRGVAALAAGVAGAASAWTVERRGVGGGRARPSRSAAALVRRG